MTTQNVKADQAWGSLANVSDTERESQMLARYAELARLTEEERRSRLLAMAQAEYSLPDEKLRPFTISRIKVWLKVEMETARLIASSYDAVMDMMPGTAAMRRIALVQTLASSFTLEDQSKLRILVPRVFAGKPDISNVVNPVPEKLEEKAQTKSKWAFWKK